MQWNSSISSSGGGIVQVKANASCDVLMYDIDDWCSGGGEGGGGVVAVVVGDVLWDRNGVKVV